MKTTIKSLFAIAIGLFVTSNVNAQDSAANNYDQGFRLGVGVNAGYVFDEPYGLALGADVRLQYDLSQRYSLALTTGFTNFFADEYRNVDHKDFGFIPVKAGFKAFVWEDRFYVLGEVGAAFAVTNRDAYENTESTSLILAPGIGYANKYVDLSLRYEHYSNFPTINSNGTVGEGTGQLSLRVAYGFKI